MTAWPLKTSRSFDEVISTMSQKTVHIRVLRGFVLSGRDKPLEPNELIEVPLILAKELIGARQAERFDPNDPANKPTSQTLTTRSQATANVDAPAPEQPARSPKAKETGGTR